MLICRAGWAAVKVARDIDFCFLAERGIALGVMWPGIDYEHVELTMSGDLGAHRETRGGLRLAPARQEWSAVLCAARRGGEMVVFTLRYDTHYALRIYI